MTTIDAVLKAMRDAETSQMKADQKLDGFLRDLQRLLNEETKNTATKIILSYESGNNIGIKFQFGETVKFKDKLIIRAFNDAPTEIILPDGEMLEANTAEECKDYILKMLEDCFATKAQKFNSP